jgi:anhydro-N-acetylmuramic acid kinase
MKEMNRNKIEILGLMSGTSLDGLDIAHVSFEFHGHKIQYKLQHAHTYSLNDSLLVELQHATKMSADQLLILDKQLGRFFAECVHRFMDEHQLKNSQIDAISSHGQTIFHQPQNGFTHQIGCGSTIAFHTGIPVINDFRNLDVIAGGQGAPLVPIGDRILFSEYDYCLNLGGFSNISFEINGKRIAFDISPVNTILNFYANTLGFDYDDKGEIARSGKINHTLLEKLNQIYFYQKKYPKSLGIEFVNHSIFPLIDSFSTTIENKLATFVEHIALQIALALPNKHGKMLITGGGAYHLFLLERIKNYLPKMEIIVPDSKTVEYKESLIFGLLGVLRLRNEINVLSSVTGAINDHCSGLIYLLPECK